MVNSFRQTNNLKQMEISAITNLDQQQQQQQINPLDNLIDYLESQFQECENLVKQLLDQCRGGNSSQTVIPRAECMDDNSQCFNGINESMANMANTVMGLTLASNALFLYFEFVRLDEFKSIIVQAQNITREAVQHKLNIVQLLTDVQPKLDQLDQLFLKLRTGATGNSGNASTSVKSLMTMTQLMGIINQVQSDFNQIELSITKLEFTIGDTKTKLKNSHQLNNSHIAIYSMNTVSTIKNLVTFGRFSTNSPLLLAANIAVTVGMGLALAVSTKMAILSKEEIGKLDHILDEVVQYKQIFGSLKDRFDKINDRIQQFIENQ
ncbi:uncharacterized protein LOC128952296 [Oppia nitens]|uniref:uncharacterized protein LOC128952296 n=1 Tax=Oppia nitens TaxID=1686743 RepID=UPI0023DA1B9D|nr:uncharacterized protein LOC128952296 [Oppia nitens]